MKQAITRRIGVALGAAAIAASAMSLAACSKSEEKPASPSSTSSATVSSTEKAVNDGWDGRPNNGGRPDFNDEGSKPNKTEPDIRGPVGQPTGQVGNN